MTFDLTGIRNENEYYTSYYFSSIFQEDAADTIKEWSARAKADEAYRTPWSRLKGSAGGILTRSRATSRIDDATRAENVRLTAAVVLDALDWSPLTGGKVALDDTASLEVLHHVEHSGGDPWLWALAVDPADGEHDALQCAVVSPETGEKQNLPGFDCADAESLVSSIFFRLDSPAPRWLLLISPRQIVLADRSKWNAKRAIIFDLDDIFGRREDTTLQAMAVLLHRDSLCPDEGEPKLDLLEESSHKHAAAVSADLKYALRESIELLGNEVVRCIKARGGDLSGLPQGEEPLAREVIRCLKSCGGDVSAMTEEQNAAFAKELSLECLRFMYRLLFILFLESRAELDYAPMKSQEYAGAYSLESLRDVVDALDAQTAQNPSVLNGTYLNQSLNTLFRLIYGGFPKDRAQIAETASTHGVFFIDPLKGHIFDTALTPLITSAEMSNETLLKILDSLSVTRPRSRKERRGRISYSALGISQMGAVYEALLSYRGFFARQKLYEVKSTADKADVLEAAWFVPEEQLDRYDPEKERVRNPDGSLKSYPAGTFIYRMSGRERETSASYYTPEVLTKCLVSHALGELLQGKTADDILALRIMEPAMGSAAFLNETINQLAEAYLDLRQKERGESIPLEERAERLQHVKMFIADRCVYGIDLNDTAVELAEVSLWLNSVHKGSFVPWFRTQLACGNSLIGARRRAYHASQLTGEKGTPKWYEAEPERVPMNEKRKPQVQIWHFLLGDPAMASYADKVVKARRPDAIKAIKDWNKKFTQAYSQDELARLRELSATIDDLWTQQVDFRRAIVDATTDPISIYGHEEREEKTTTVRKKDELYEQLYRTRGGQNASCYARLKFAMDYWCALWFWPIDKAYLLPTRAQFLDEIELILRGEKDRFDTGTGQNVFDFYAESLPGIQKQLHDAFGSLDYVDLGHLCAASERLRTVRELAEKHRFLHWELEFADVFADRGGFDLIVGNPPWIKIEWNEQSSLGDMDAQFVVKNFTAAQTARARETVLQSPCNEARYMADYEGSAATQNFLNATVNYAVLKGSQTNLFKCFLPQAWDFGGKKAVCAFVHPIDVFNDPSGVFLREQAYKRLKKHFQFHNENILFSDIGHQMTYSLNIYRNGVPDVRFDLIADLYNPLTIKACYDDEMSGKVLGRKSEQGGWEYKGNADRIVTVTKRELMTFARLFDGNNLWQSAQLPSLHDRRMMPLLEKLADHPCTIGSLENSLFSTQLWNETGAQKDGILKLHVHFPVTPIELIYTGPNIYVGNPLFKSARRICVKKGDFDSIDLMNAPEDCMQRCKYGLACDEKKYLGKVPKTPWGTSYIGEYRVAMRRRLNRPGERTLLPSIIPPGTGHVHTITGIALQGKIAAVSGTLMSMVADFFVKTSGRKDLYLRDLSPFPLILDGPIAQAVAARALLLNCLTVHYADLWAREFDPAFCFMNWGKADPRLSGARFASLTPEWTRDVPLRTDYERRQALVELDVLTAMAFGITLDELKAMYAIQFPVLRQYEADTWYDQNGRIVFTVNRSLTGVGLDRKTWEQVRGKTFGTVTREVDDDTLPNGPVHRTIEYAAPFDRCDREADYETVWKAFATLARG